jgi:hypothetical protein
VADPYTPPNDPFGNPVPVPRPDVVAGPGIPTSPYSSPVARTNGMAVASLVLGILWMYGIGAILALVFGYLAKGQIDRSAGAQSGRGLAIAGIVLGWIGVAGTAFIILLLAVAIRQEGGLNFGP